MNSSKLKQLFPDNGLQLGGSHELSAKLNCKNGFVWLKWVTAEKRETMYSSLPRPFQHPVT